MTTIELLSKLEQLGVKLWAEGERLRYDAPPGVMGPDLRAEMGRRKTQIIDFLNSAKHISTVERPPLEPVVRDGPLPLSFAQQRLWFLQQLAPDSPFYNMPVALTLLGPLDRIALQRSLDEIVARHENLRTTFGEIDGTPVQVIGQPEPVVMPVVNLEGSPPAEREAEANRLATEEVRGLFDLARGPLLRTRLLRLDAQHHVLVLTLHHIVSDGWSVGVLLAEFAPLYKAFCAGRPSPLEPLPIQYGDFSVWQRQWLSGEALQSQLDFWKQQLAGMEPLHLPTDRPRPAEERFQGALTTMALSKPLSDRLKQLSVQEGVTLFMMLLAAFKALLHHYNGQDEIVVGGLIANRNFVQIERLIGFFVNTLVLRTKCNGDPTFHEFLGRVRDVSLDAFAHQDLPFERLVEEVVPHRDLSRNPLIQMLFAVQNAPMPDMDLGDVRMNLGWAETRVSRLDLEVNVWDGAEELSVWVRYNTDLFDEATIERLLQHYERILEDAAANPQKRLSELSLMSDQEHHQVVVGWNQTNSTYPRESTIHELFEDQVERLPDAVAISFEDESLTYRQLDARANQLARHLRRRGVGPEVLVGLCMRRSVEMVVGMLAILKAGGAYVPLDPDYPKQRLALMIQDTAAPLLLTQKRTRASLPPCDAQVICLDSDRPEVAGETDDPLRPCATHGNLAYVIYTSGSTGVPKGVSVAHRAVIRLVCEADYVRIEPSDRIAQVSNSSFDAMTFEVWGSLLNGACLVGIPQATVLSPPSLASQLREQRISALFLTTALFNQMAAEKPTAFGGVCHVLFGGETVDPESVRKVLEHGGPQRLLHVYGPTENTTFTTWHQVGDVPEGARTVPIGRPISNTHVYVVDERLNPVPVGVGGELTIGGDGLAQGYLHDGGLTADRFVPNPFSIEGGERLYRTGDEVRWRKNGSIEFLGRSDHQVKIRGFRIELAEIEIAMGRHELVREVVALVREEQPGQKRLVAYVVPVHPTSPSIGELRRHLKQMLPDYMVPSEFVFLEAIPLTPNGKVDRAALPAPDQTRPELDVPFVGPRTVHERILVDIWAEILSVDRLGIHDNFFELGGHSLLAVQVISRMRDAMGLALPVSSVFEFPTIAELSGLATASAWVTQDADVSTNAVPIGRETGEI